MTASTSDLVRINRFSTGRRLFTLGQVLEVARRWENARLVTRAEAALAHDRDTLEKEARWRRTRATKSKARGRAFEVDHQIDRVLGGMHTTVQVLLATLPPTGERATAARAFLERFFPEGAAAITRTELEEELATVEHMVAELARMSEAEQKALNVDYYVAELARLAPELSAELRRPADDFEFDTLRAARERGHENLCEVIATIIAEHPGRERANVDARRALLAPVVEQNARVSARRRRRPAPDVDVDPNTGEELERDGDEEPVEPA